jgi:hypothetical protein
MSNLSFFRVAARAIVLLGILASSASAQIYRPPVERIANLSGPRFGLTVLGGGITDRLRRETEIDVAPLITQFGWQYEKQFGSSDASVTGITEVVMLAGGIEQNQFLPSLSWLVGFRTASGYEFAVGPNLTPISSAIAFAGGLTRRYGPLNVPFNVAVVPSNAGVRVSVLTGFNMRN